MDPPGLSEIEDRIGQLSFADQLLLIERLAQRIREQLSDRDTGGAQLFEMAADLQIQHELRRIEEEFAPVSADGPAVS